MSTTRAMPGGWAKRDELARGANGRVLCRWCQLEVPSSRQTFCSEWCVEEWRIRSNPGHLRQRVLERDGGVCAVCGLDCVAEFRRMQRLRGPAKAKARLEWKSGSRKSLWDADHIVPVVEGGGECDLSNLRTLCLRCHRLHTAELRRGRREAGDQAETALNERSISSGKP